VLSTTLPSSIQSGLLQQGVPAQAAAGRQVCRTGALFAAFLGINPMQSVLRRCAERAGTSARDTNVGTSFFPNVLGLPFTSALRDIFWLSAGLALLERCAPTAREPFIYEEQATRSAAGQPSRRDGRSAA